MVIFREIDRPPISLILPHLYLGAESDVTQDCLSSQGISYVLSVSRCCPQPDFLPQSQYLRIPINDSLRDELLPWIPEALRFIDGAISLGCSILIHCAAGVSRSPAVAVAYVMYRLGLDLDDAYRFVKERRPSISPNFNFLGQLQYFQGTLALVKPNAEVPEAVLCTTNEDVCCSPVLPVSNNQDTLSVDAPKISYVSKDCREGITQDENCADVSYDHTAHRNPNQESNETLAVSERLQALTLSLEEKVMKSSSEFLIQNQNSIKNVQPKPRELKISPGSTSLSDRRKTLTLSLSPMEPDTQIHKQSSSCISCTKNNHKKDLTNKDCSSKTGQKREVTPSTNTRRLNKMSSPDNLSGSSEKSERETASSCSQKRQKNGECKSSYDTKRQNKVDRDSSFNPVFQKNRQSNHSNANHEQNENCYPSTAQSHINKCSSTDEHQKAPEGHCTSAIEAVENVDLEQSALSPLNLTISKLLNWGEKMLLGALLGPRIKVGQAVLPYRC
ncbi:hypothetical protein JZ751_026321 [Albula glossodonta]|uniref:protein-tyrosine-phosphatase n=1 Tax=Albula glossodonta TaxID=121402 RepID=A0A8T2PKB6_9TELE|nr:hypothetical protein JZ751_026321 [Albula glossodonta]